MLLDAVRIAVPDDDFPRAETSYAVLLGAGGEAIADGRRFELARGAVELVRGTPGGLRALVFVAPERPAADFHGIDVLVRAAQPTAPRAADVAIDHVVVRTTDPERAIALWRDRLGVRLAFDRAFPARGLRLLFFRSNRITLEYAAPHPAVADPGGDDVLWGVSYRVTDLHAKRAALVAAGVDVSEPRPGNKTGTTVMTVRSGTCGVPTLMLQDDPPA